MLSCNFSRNILSIRTWYSRYFSKSDIDIIKKEYKKYSDDFNKASIQLISVVVPNIVKKLDPDGFDDIMKNFDKPLSQDEYDESKAKEVKMYFLSKCADHLTLPDSVFGPLGALSAKYSPEKLSESINQVMSSLE